VRILQLCTRFPPAPGGVETHVLEISKRMRLAGHDVEVFTSDLYSETPFVRMEKWDREVEGVPVRRFKAYTPGGEAHYLLYPSMKRAVMTARADVFHAHSYGYFQTNLLPWLRKLRGAPTVLTAHFHPEWSTWGGEKRRGLRKVYDSTLGKAVLNNVDIVIAHTREEIGLMKQSGLDDSGKRVRIVPAGIDFRKYEAVPDGAPFREHFGIGADEQVVLFSGRLAQNKGLMVLAEAAPSVLKSFPKARFVLVGQDMGVQEKLQKRLAGLGVKERFLLTGHVKDDALFRSAYGACDVFVLPSEYEAFGLVLLEAMASEKPVVASAVGGMPEVLGAGCRVQGAAGTVTATECGLLVGYEDAPALAEAISKLLGDEALRHRMGAAGRERVRKEFNWDSVTSRILEIYRELVDRGRRR
jgi:glycosyltransferase involved in cell wall biosynthesis